MSGGLLVALLLVVLAVIRAWSKRDSKYREIIDRIPGPRSTLPLLGNAHLLKQGYEGTQQMLQLCKDYGGSTGLTRLWVGTVPYIVFSRADPCQVLFSTSTHTKRAYFYRLIEPWLNKGLLTSDGDKWKRHRRILTPTFHFEILKDFMSVFNEQSKIMVGLLEKEAKRHKAFDIVPYITRCALDIICETAMGRHVNAQAYRDGGYADTVDAMTKVVQSRINDPIMQNDFLFSLSSKGREQRRCLRTLHGFTITTIKERNEILDQQLREDTGKVRLEDLKEGRPFLIGKQKRLAFLDMLLILAKGSGDIDVSEIQDQVDTFMYAGHDTTSTAIIWVLYVMGRYPEIQERVHQEMLEIFRGSDRDVTSEDLRDMKYLDCVVKETMRLYPPVPMLAREAGEDCVIEGYQIPKGTVLMVQTPALHLDPVHFPDPERFDPERWTPDNSADRHPFCFVPFSAGMRNCIGQRFALMEIKVMVAITVRNFAVEATQSLAQIRPVANLLLRPETTADLILTKRM